MTKKERREIRRQENRSEIGRQARSRTIRRVAMWLVVAVILAGIGWLVWRAAQKSPGQEAQGTLSVAVTASDNILGADDAPITLVEYGDFQCPACRSYHPLIKRLLTEADGRVRLVFRHFPLKQIHPNAELSSRAVQAAGLQGKFWEMLDVAYDRQTEWAGLSRAAAREKFLAYAAELGLDSSRLDDDMDSDAVSEKIDADISSGKGSDISSTPSFFVNGKLISGFASYDDFKNAVLGAAPGEGNPMPNNEDGTNAPASPEVQ